MRALLLLAISGLTLAASPKAELWFFLLEDCPVSKYYGPEIERICQSERSNGVTCTAWFVNEALTDAQAQQFAAAMGLRHVEIRVDRGHKKVKRSGATVTPQAAVFAADGQLAYLGRIDNYFYGWGRRRGGVTEHDLESALAAIRKGAAAPQPWPTPVGCYIERKGETK